jgi:hypothetical protein
MSNTALLEFDMKTLHEPFIDNARIKNFSILLFLDDNNKTKTKLLENITNNIPTTMCKTFITEQPIESLRENGFTIYNKSELENTLTNIMKKQKEDYLDKSKEQNEHFIILDLGFQDLPKSELMREIILNGRHYRITLVIISQTNNHNKYPNFPPEIRTNIDFIFVCQNNIKQQQTIQKQIHNDYAGMYSFETFTQFIDDDEYDYIIISQHNKKCLFYNIN